MPNYNVNSNKKKEIIEKYNASSEYYDKRYKRIQQEKYKTVIENLQPKNNIILDVGCGSGLLFEFILKESKNNQIWYSPYIGIDISLNMLRNFVKKYQYWIKHLNVNLILADMENLPIRKNKIDTIYSITSLQNLYNIISGIKEIISVSKHMANVHFSILKKPLDLEPMIRFLKQNIINLKITNNKGLEDLILQGKIIKD